MPQVRDGPARAVQGQGGHRHLLQLQGDLAGLGRAGAADEGRGRGLRHGDALGAGAVQEEVKLSVEQVRHVANLARLQLSAEEEERFAAQLSAILEAVAELEQADTGQVEPTSHATLAADLLRPDEVRPSMDPERALQNAPAKVGTSFAVPKVIE